MKTEQEVQDWIAQYYPVRYSGSGFLYHSRIVTDMLNGVRMSDRRSDKVLDVGCGIGFVSQLYPNFDITGVDISDEMLKRNPFKHLKAPAENLPFPDDHFDFVICRSLLHHLEEPLIGLKEMFRVLKPGGKWVCWDPNYSFFVNLFRKLFQRTDRFSHLHKSFTVRELRRMLDESGFHIEKTHFIGFLAYPLLGFPDIKNFHIPIGLGKILMLIDELIAKTPLQSMAWSVMIKASK
jgi:ubiquinone/menaquinone biosynthesis C-methylase UbiE